MEKQKQQSSGFLNGFMLGLLIGAGVAVLLTTKKGKRMLRTITEEGLDSITNLDELYKRFEKVMKEPESPQQFMEDDDDFVDSTPRERFTESPKGGQDYIVKKPVLIAADDQTSTKLAEVQQRFDKEIEDVSKAISTKFVPYADDESDIEEPEAPVAKIKVTRRRFFRGIQRRN